MSVDAAKPSEGVVWPRLLALLPALNPVLVLVVGALLNGNINSTKQQLDQKLSEIQALKTEAETLNIKAQTQVNRVKVVQDFLDALSGPDGARRRVAIEAIFIVLPDDAPRLVKAIEQRSSGVDAADTAAAKAALDGTRSRVVADMFASDRTVRVAALHSLQQGWTDDEAVIAQLVDRAMQDVQARAASAWAAPGDERARQQLASISNTAEFLTGAKVATPAVRDKVLAFAGQAERNSADTARFASLIRQRLRP